MTSPGSEDEDRSRMKPDEAVWMILLPDGTFYPRYEDVKIPAMWHAKADAEFLRERLGPQREGSKVVSVAFRLADKDPVYEDDDNGVPEQHADWIRAKAEELFNVPKDSQAVHGRLFVDDDGVWVPTIRFIPKEEVFGWHQWAPKYLEENP